MSEPFLGEIKIISWNFPPKGWAFCNGSLLAISQNQALFSILGTTYGGDGMRTFGLPNLQGRTAFHVGNGIVLAVFLVSWLLRLSAPSNPSVVAYILSFLGAALLGGTGWLGGELTGRFGVGIEEGANVNAPMTFSGLPANAVPPAGRNSPEDKTPVVE